MGSKAKVTYIKHSGFFVETENSCLLFDYWEGKLPEIPSKKPLYIFSSHIHHDHYSRDIFKLESASVKVNYILSFDIKESDNSWKKAENVTFVNPHEKVEIDGCLVETLTSTDEGVAFLVDIDDLHIYHAGDLHCWEWPGDPDEDNRRRITNYQKEIDCLKNRSFDFSFVVLDPRQEEVGGKGMDYFLKNVRSRVVFPMHLWEDYGYEEKYIESNQGKYPMTKIINITSCEQNFVIS